MFFNFLLRSKVDDGVRIAGNGAQASAIAAVATEQRGFRVLLLFTDRHVQLLQHRKLKLHGVTKLTVSLNDNAPIP